MSYLDIINDIIEIEGGFVNNPYDRGGPTKYGITKKVYETFKNREVTIDEIINMNIKDAIFIYTKEYYLKPKIDLLENEFLQSIILDMSINHGASRAIKILQKTINNLEFTNILIEDGILGKQSRKASNYCYTFMARYFTNEICNNRKQFYKNIVKEDPTQGIFLKGWLKRNNSFWSNIPYDTIFYRKNNN